MARLDIKGFPDDLDARLEQLSRELGVSKKDLLVDLVRKGLAVGVGVPFSVTDVFARFIVRVAKQYGISPSEALYLLVFVGLAHQDDLKQIVPWYLLGKGVIPDLSRLSVVSGSGSAAQPTQSDTSASAESFLE